MLQLVVEDADKFVANTTSIGVEAFGAMDTHGERIYYMKTPSGINMSFQSNNLFHISLLLVNNSSTMLILIH